jgi:hypothetical protein
VQLQVDAGFGVPDSRWALHIPHLPLPTDMQPCHKALVLSVPSPSSYGLGELFQSHCDSDERLLDIVNLSSRTHQNDESPDDKSANSYYPLSTKRDSKAFDSDVDNLFQSKKPRMMPEYRNIVPKHNNPSAEIIESVGSSNVVRRGLKKGGRQGSLKPEKRKKATEMRDVRACASCYISHIEVSGKSASNNSKLTINKSVQKNLCVTNAEREMRKVHSNRQVV